eukprot:CAMPEP_0171288650 /NCGR_PEP_ID=MMETSP0790-20130122/70203_1 /TAXON_ID=2925 /ORGANISM="Alexandrium catenella, Strain OF101" /LENGTH=85 /DNA_ID=CAMNT_0011758263 /DNA_START=11 /DNA_END=265 /DNA_ORIENTATION=-
MARSSRPPAACGKSTPATVGSAGVTVLQGSGGGGTGTGSGWEATAAGGRSKRRKSVTTMYAHTGGWLSSSCAPLAATIAATAHPA